MVKFITDPIYLPDNYTWADLEDAKLSAKWRKVTGREEIMERTDLKNKCGSCEFFNPLGGTLKCYGNCQKRKVSPRPRTIKACREYKEKKDE